MQKNKKTILIVVVVLIALLLLILLFKPEWIQKSWQWVVGLAGLVALAFKRFFGFLNGSKDLNEITVENEAIKTRLLEIDQEFADTKLRLERERALHKREIELIEKQIAFRETEINNQENNLKKLQSMGYKEYLDNLPPEEKKKLLNDNIIDLP